MGRFNVFTELSLSELEAIFSNVVKKEFDARIAAFRGELEMSVSPSQEKGWMDRKAVGKALGLSYPTIAKLTREGKLAARVFGGKYMYRSEDINRVTSSTKRQ